MNKESFNKYPLFTQIGHDIAGQNKGQINRYRQNVYEEYRAASLVKPELANRKIFIGYASVFNNIDKHGDTILPGAFKNTLKKHRSVGIKLLWQHKSNYPIGKIIDFTEDNKGLLMKAELILEVQKSKEAYELIKQGAIRGLSIGFNIVKASKNQTNNKRIISEIDLIEVSVVTFPANQEAQIVFIN